MLTVDVVRENDVDGAVLRLGGEIDILTAPAVTAVARSLLTGPPAPLVIDFTAVTFVDSSALAALVELRRLCTDTPGSTLLLRNPRSNLEKLMKLTMMYDLFAWLPNSATPAAPRPEEPLPGQG